PARWAAGQNPHGQSLVSHHRRHHYHRLRTTVDGTLEDQHALQRHALLLATETAWDARLDGLRDGFRCRMDAVHRPNLRWHHRISGDERRLEDRTIPFLFLCCWPGRAVSADGFGDQ